MPTMGTQTYNGETVWYINDTVTTTGTFSKNYYFPVSQKSLDKNIKYSVTFSNLATLNGTSFPTGTGNNLINTTAGWYFPSTTTKPEITITTSPTSYDSNTQTLNPGSYDFSIAPQKASNSVLLLKTKDKAFSMMDVNLSIYLTGVNRTTYGGTSALRALTPGWMHANKMYVQATASGTSKRSYTGSTTNYNSWSPTSSDERLVVEGWMGSNRTYTTLGGSMYAYYFYIQQSGTINRSGTGSPGSPYYYTGSKYTKLYYKRADNSSWTNISTASVSGSSGYSDSASWSVYRNDSTNYYLKIISLGS